MRFDEMFKEMQKDKVDASFISSPKYDGVYKWHKTTDKLPPVGCYVLGYVEPNNNDARYYAIVKRKDCGFDTFKTNVGFYYDTEEVTHWTHLPNAPKEKTND